MQEEKETRCIGQQAELKPVTLLEIWEVAGRGAGGVSAPLLLAAPLAGQALGQALDR